MAWNTLTYACGCEDRVQLYGKMTDREKTIERASRHDCPVCRAKKTNEAARANGLPELVGSPKQIAWASDIRSRVLATADPEKAAKLALITSAKQWIEIGR